MFDRILPRREVIFCQKNSPLHGRSFQTTIKPKLLLPSLFPWKPQVSTSQTTWRKKNLLFHPMRICVCLSCLCTHLYKNITVQIFYFGFPEYKLICLHMRDFFTNVLSFLKGPQNLVFFHAVRIDCEWIWLSIILVFAVMEVSAVKVTKDQPAMTYPSFKDQKWQDDQITIPMENIEAMSDGGKDFCVWEISHLSKSSFSMKFPWVIVTCGWLGYDPLGMRSKFIVIW